MVSQIPRDFKFNGVSLLLNMLEAGFVTLLHSQASNKERVQLALIWVASINLDSRYRLVPPALLHPFSNGWQLHEETAMAMMQLRMQSLRESLSQTDRRSECALADLRLGVFAHPNTAALRVCLPPSGCLQRIHQLTEFQLQNGTDLLPGTVTVSVGDSSEAAISITAGGLFRAQEGQGKW